MTEPRLMNLMYTPFPLLVFSMSNESEETTVRKDKNVIQNIYRKKEVSDK